MKEQHKSRCLLCSLGCGFIIETDNDEAVNLEYDLSDPIGGGALCGKGNYMLELINHPMRLAEPCSTGKAVSWNQALDGIADKLSNYTDTKSVGLVIDGASSNEDIITAQLFAEKCIGSDWLAVNFPTGDDDVTRAIASAGVTSAKVNPNAIAESECILAVGDPFEIAPVLAGSMLKAKYASRHTILAVISDGENRTSRFASTHLIGQERKTLAEFLRAVADIVEGGPSWLAAVKEQLPLSGNPALVETARAFVDTPSSGIILETQDPVAAKLAAAIALASGKSGHFHSLSSYGNTAGICGIVDGVKSVGNIIDAVVSGEIKALISLGADLVKGNPDRDIASALKKLEYFAAGAAFENETTMIADPVLPTALWLESEGTFNGQLLNPVIEPPGGALSYGEILRRLTAKMGYDIPAEPKESAIGSMELSADRISDLLKMSSERAELPAVRSTTIDFADGSLTGNMSWITMQGRSSW